MATVLPMIELIAGWSVCSSLIVIICILRSLTVRISLATKGNRSRRSSKACRIRLKYYSCQGIVHKHRVTTYNHRYVAWSPAGPGSPGCSVFTATGRYPIVVVEVEVKGRRTSRGVSLPDLLIVRIVIVSRIKGRYNQVVSTSRRVKGPNLC